MSIPALHIVEGRFDSVSVKKWMDHHWHWSLYASAIYLLTIYVGSRLMRNRKPFQLRRGKESRGGEEEGRRVEAGRREVRSDGGSFAWLHGN